MTRRSSGPTGSDRRDTSSLRPLAALAYRASPRAATLAAGVTVLWGVLPATLNLATGAVVESVTGAVGQGWNSPAGRSMLLALSLAALAYIALNVVPPVREVVADLLMRRVDESLSLRVMEATARPQGIAHLEDPEVLDLAQQAQGAVTGHTAGGGVFHGTAVVGARIQGAAALAILAAFRWWLPAIVAASQLLAFRIRRRHWLVTTGVIFRRTDVLRRSNYLRRLAVEAAAAKEIRVYGLCDWLVGRYRELFVHAMTPVWRERRRGGLLALGLGAVVLVVDGWVLWSIARAGLGGDIGPGAVAVYAQAVLGAGALGAYTESHLAVADGLASLRVLERLEGSLPDVAAPDAGTTDARTTSVAPAEGRPASSLRFEAVSFRYPGQATDVIDGLDLDVEVGRSTALVGENGAGKTTLVKLLSGLYAPTAGRITADGNDIAGLDRWPRQVAAIFQDFARYPFSAHDNVAVGALHRGGDRDLVAEAARRVGAERIVAGLPRGWDTLLDRRLSGGVELSGGEWQRIALARALFAVAGGATVLVLDEPTASLDVRAEAELYDRFLDLTRGVTTILISHRFSTVRRADRIVVLEGGRLTEDGTHDELVAAGGRYARMYALQAMRFRSEATGA